MDSEPDVTPHRFFPYYLVEWGEHSCLQFNPDVRVRRNPNLDDVLQGVCRCPRPKFQPRTPCRTDTCWPICNGRCGPLSARFQGILEEFRTPYYFRTTRWGLVNASVVRVTDLLVVMEVYPKWILRDRIDPTATGLYDFDRMTGENREGHYLPEHLRFRIEAYLLPAIKEKARLDRELLDRISG